MKTIITSGTNIIKGNITNIIVESDQFKLTFDSSVTVYFEKKNYNEDLFMNMMNNLKNININSKGIFYINVPRGIIEQKNTEVSNKEYDSIGFNTSDEIKAKATKPLIDGVFTQEPQGNTTNLNKDVLERYKKSLAQKSTKI